MGVSDTDASENLVCIGGPADGRRIKVNGRYPTVTIPHAQPLPRIDWNPDAPLPASTVTLSYTVYRRHLWRAEGNIRYVLTPHDQSPEATLDMLIDRYPRDR